MSQSWPKPGIGHVGEYQVSGQILPLTGDGSVINLAKVASGITLSAPSSDSTVTFYDGSGNTSVFVVPAGSSVYLRGKFKKLSIDNNGYAIVELTNILSSMYKPEDFADLYS